MQGIQTSSRRVKTVVRTVREEAAAAFGDRCVAVYLMGSLARGGFSEAASDIDIGVVLAGPLEAGDAARIAGIVGRAQQSSGPVPNAVSIFWGSVESLNGLAAGGRFPPFDQLDLIDSGLLLHGADVRPELRRPDQRELVVAGAAFALNRLGNDDRLVELSDVERIVAQGLVHLTKTVLFPARFIYLERTGRVAGNDISAEYYCDRFEGPDAELVGHAMRWRSEPLPPAAEICELLEQGLVPLYRRFLDVYVTRLEAESEVDLAARLSSWRRALASHRTTPDTTDRAER